MHATTHRTAREQQPAASSQQPAAKSTTLHERCQTRVSMSWWFCRPPPTRPCWWCPRTTTAGDQTPRVPRWPLVQRHRCCTAPRWRWRRCPSCCRRPTHRHPACRKTHDSPPQQTQVKGGRERAQSDTKHCGINPRTMRRGSAPPGSAEWWSRGQPSPTTASGRTTTPRSLCTTQLCTPNTRTHTPTHKINTKSTQHHHRERRGKGQNATAAGSVCVCVCVCVCVLEEGGIPAPRHKTVTRQLARRRRGLFAHTWECPPQTRRPPRRTHVHRQQTTDPAAPSETNARTEGETAARPKTGGRSAHCAMGELCQTPGRDPGVPRRQPSRSTTRHAPSAAATAHSAANTAAATRIGPTNKHRKVGRD